MLTASTLFWGGNFVVGRAVSTSIPPLTLNFYRWLVATLILMVMAGPRLRGTLPTIFKHRRWFLLMAVTGVVLFHAFVYTGLGHTTAVNATLMMATSPAVIPAVARVMKGERVSRPQIAGITLTIVGVVTILARGSLQALMTLTMSPGDGLVVGAVVIWAVYSVALADRPPDLPPLVMLTIISMIGLFLMVPLYVLELTARGGFEVSIPHLLTLGYVGVFASVLAYLAWNRGVAEVGAVRAGPFLNLMPVFGALLAVIFLHESIHGYHLAGTLAIGCGLWLSTRR